MKAFDRMLTGQNLEVMAFVAQTLGVDADNFGKYNCLWFEDSRGVKAAFVYNHFHKPTISIHAATRPGALWCQSELLYHIFAYPFEFLECVRVSAPVQSTNLACRKACEALGFKLEGTLRRADASGCDVLIYGMLKEECRWLNYQERLAA